MLCLPSMLLSPRICFGGKSMLFAKIAVSKCLNRPGALWILYRLLIPNQMTARFKFGVHRNLMKQLILNSIPEFANLEQETSSVKLMDCSNWIHNDRKIVFLTDGSALRGSEVWSIAACRKRKQSFCSKILDTGVSILDEPSYRIQTLFFHFEATWRKKLFARCCECTWLTLTVTLKFWNQTFFDQLNSFTRNTWMQQVKSYLCLHKHALKPLQPCLYIDAESQISSDGAPVRNGTESLKSQRGARTAELRGSGFTKWEGSERGMSRDETHPLHQICDL